MDEFELIRRYFDRQNEAAGVVTGIGDDGAVLACDSSRQQVQVIDTLVEGVHFPRGTEPADVAYRAVAVNLSDIAAMGAQPRWMLLALTINNSEESWLASFAGGLFEIADRYGVTLVGGDTTRGPAVTVTVTLTGEVAEGTALLRSGARVGDGIYVTGTLGDAAAGLQMIAADAHDEFLCGRFLRPTPRVATGVALAGSASAAIDISDGLAGDLSKLVTASDVGASVDIETLPMSDALRDRFDASQRERFALLGGDDYELCFTAPPAAVAAIADVSRIGTIVEPLGLVFHSRGNVVHVDDSGYRHFS